MYKLIVKERVLFDECEDCFDLMDSIMRQNDIISKNVCLNYTTTSDLIEEYEEFIKEEKEDKDGNPNITLDKYFKDLTSHTIEMLRSFEEDGAKILDYLSSGGDRSLFIIEKNRIDSDFLLFYYDTHDSDVEEYDEVKEGELERIYEIIEDVNYAASYDDDKIPDIKVGEIAEAYLIYNGEHDFFGGQFDEDEGFIGSCYGFKWPEDYREDEIEDFGNMEYEGKFLDQEKLNELVKKYYETDEEEENGYARQSILEEILKLEVEVTDIFTL